MKTKREISRGKPKLFLVTFTALVMNMVYEVSGDQIITDQPSNPQKEISKFYFEPSGILVVDHQGEKTRIMREP